MPPHPCLAGRQAIPLPPAYRQAGKGRGEDEGEDSIDKK